MSDLPAADEAASPVQPELLIFVHGTGAADPADRGTSWWQLGSAFEKVVSKGLGPTLIVERPFHWSGANSEEARRSAGHRLHNELRALEEKGGRYHLLGHSHGGSVIWHALRASASAGQRLTGCRHGQLSEHPS